MARLAVAVALVLFALANLALAEREPNPVRLPRTTPPTSIATVVVVRGDHLWKISERHLDSVLGRKATDGEVSPYWRRVIEANREGLRSGDPDLIYPGEVVSLPEVDLSAGR